MRIVRYADISSMPWTNGAGETRELWSDETGEGRGFTRRISIASLIRPAPFSHLRGMVRTFMPIDDITLQLLIDGRPVTVHRLECVRFSGHSTVSLVELDRPGRVLNVMSEAATWNHTVSIDGDREVCDAALLLEDGPAGHVGDLLIGLDLSGRASLPVAAIRFAER